MRSTFLCNEMDDNKTKKSDGGGRGGEYKKIEDEKNG